MNILQPYAGIKAYTNEKDLINQYESMIQDLKRKRDNEVLSSNLNLLKNFNFRKKLINQYRNNVDDLCCDILMINVIKQAYQPDKNLSILEVGYENDSTARCLYTYSKGYTTAFDNLETEIIEISDQIYGDNCFSDICALGYFTPDGYYKNLIDCDFEHDQDYEGQYTYFMETSMYPIVLELEKLINSKKEEFKELILEEYNENF